MISTEVSSFEAHNTKLHALDEDQSILQGDKDDDGDHEVLQSNVKFASLKEQALFYGDIPDDRLP
jgi:hypothetical protein